MMISPEVYYEEYLKGKDERQILSVIRGLKNKIGHLKNVMEHPDYCSKKIIYPSEETRLYCNRMYLERAKQALIEVGGTYKASQVEMRAADFQKSVPFIRMIVCEIGGFFGGYYRYIATFENDMLNIAVEHLGVLIPTPQPLIIYSKQSFLKAIQSLNMGEWRHYYSPERFGYSVLDGTQWSVNVEFCNGHRPFSFEGSNSYPYNFYKFKELFNISDEYE